MAALDSSDTGRGRQLGFQRRWGCKIASPVLHVYQLSSADRSRGCRIYDGMRNTRFGRKGSYYSQRRLRLSVVRQSAHIGGLSTCCYRCSSAHGEEGRRLSLGAPCHHWSHRLLVLLVDLFCKPQESAVFSFVTRHYVRLTLPGLLFQEPDRGLAYSIPSNPCGFPNRKGTRAVSQIGRATQPTDQVARCRLSHQTYASRPR